VLITNLLLNVMLLNIEQLADAEARRSPMVDMTCHTPQAFKLKFHPSPSSSCHLLPGPTLHSHSSPLCLDYAVSTPPSSLSSTGSHSIVSNNKMTALVSNNKTTAPLSNDKMMVLPCFHHVMVTSRAPTACYICHVTTTRWTATLLTLLAMSQQ